MVDLHNNDIILITDQYIKFKDGTFLFKNKNPKAGKRKKFYTVEGSKEVFYYEGVNGFHRNDWKRKLDRMCGITDHMHEFPTKVNSVIHTVMFLSVPTVLVAVALIIYNLIR